ncbi:beta strand repeat-containing protein [Campylobacter concisus]|uniref:beta strand repeat-containing protein n=1 Tax=Campylobacter concisus TaxID=199 RepID=UPI000CD9977B|nr:retention module-containing protein [Campylobacter concisus]
MANEAGVVKSVTGGSVRALNNATGEVRNLSVGDIVYQNEKIITDSADSKVTITQTDGKEITLIGKDTITLDQDTNSNQTVADISALQKAILNGTDLNALEETAAGGPQAGGNGGDGVSLSSTSFAEGGHISNINANVGSIDALSLAAGGDNSFGVSGGSAVGAGAGATTPKIGINISSAGSIEGGVMTYDLSLPTALTARPTTLNLNFSGGVAGKDYDANSIEYSTDGGSTWTHGTIVNLADANQINNVKVKVKTIDNYGLKDVDLAHNPTAMGVNQNQGEQDGSKYSNLNGVEYGIYKRNLTLNVTTDNDEIANSQANGKITDNDDYVNINQGLNGANIATEDGEDTLNMNTGAYANSDINLGVGDDALNIKGGTFSKVDIDLGSGNNNVTIENSFGDVDDNSYNKTRIMNWQSGNDTVTIKSGATVKNAEIGVHNGEDVITLEKDATLEHSRVIMGDGNDKLNINGTVTRESHINLDNGEDTLNVGEGAKISDSDIQTDDSGNGYKDTVKIANKVTLENWADIQAGGGNDEITAGDNLTLSNHSGIHGDWGNNGSAGTGSDDGDDIIKIGKNLTMSGGSVISGGGGNDEITIGDKANISNSTIDSGAGKDEIYMTNGTKVTNSKILMGDGINTLNITRKEIDPDDDDQSYDGSINLDSVKIQGGAGEDIVNISNTKKGLVVDPKVKLENDTSMNLGDGDNKVTVDGSVLLGKIENSTPKNIIKTGSGKDNITLQNGAGIEERVIETGEGADQVNVYDGAYLNSAKIETGKGDDVVRFEYLTRNPLQGYGYSAATGTDINMGDGDDSLVLTGMGNSGNYANRTSDFQGVNIDMGDNGIKRVQINRGKVDTTDIKTGSGNDLVQIQGDSLMEGRNSINTGAGVDEVDIIDSKLNGISNSEKTKIDTGADGDHVVIRNSTLTHAEINTDSGEDIVDIEETLSGDDSSINTGADTDTVNISGNITATSRARDFNILTGDGSDKINIASGATLKYTSIETGAGGETIKINDGKTDVADRITFEGSSLDTGADIDIVEITNTTFMKGDAGNTYDDLSNLKTQDGNDIVTIKAGTIFQDFSYIATGNGVDTINLESGAKFNQANVYADAGDDIINVNGAEFKDGGIHGGVGGDQIFVNSGKFDNASIEGDAGNDTIHIKAGARFENSSIYGDGLLGETGNDTIIVEKGATLINTTINGGAGYDTLKIADDSVNLTKVTNIEKLDLTEGNHNMTLSAKDVLDMTDSNNRLRIDGDSGDNLGLASKGWIEDTSANITGYKVYTNTEGGTTVTLEVQNQVHADL